MKTKKQIEDKLEELNNSLKKYEDAYELRDASSNIHLIELLRTEMTEIIIEIQMLKWVLDDED